MPAVGKGRNAIDCVRTAVPAERPQPCGVADISDGAAAGRAVCVDSVREMEREETE